MSGWERIITEEDLLETKRTFSFYHNLIARFWAGGPGELNSAPLNRFCTLARKMGVRFVFVEDAFRRRAVADAVRRLEQLCPTDGTVSAVTLSFLWSEPGGSDADGSDDPLIAQATVITFPDLDGDRSFVLDGFIREPCKRTGRKGLRPLLNQHLPISQWFEAKVGGQTYQLKGAYFRQNDGFLGRQVDASTAVVLRALKGSQMPARIALPTASASEALQAAGFDVVSYRISGQRVSRDEAWGLIAALLESGSPVLLDCALDDERHTLAVLGYRINSDEWHPAVAATLGKRGGGMSSSAWVDSLIAHHPAFGPYISLSRGWLADAPSADMGNRLVPLEVTAPLPKGASVSPMIAETVARNAVSQWLSSLDLVYPGRGRWWRYLVRSASLAVLRTTLMARKDYLYHLEHLLPAQPSPAVETALNEFRRVLPDHFWMSEVSLPQLFMGNRAKLGEMIVRADRYDEDATSDRNVLAFRLPSLLAWRGEGSAFRIVRGGSLGHQPLYASGCSDIW